MMPRLLTLTCFASMLALVFGLAVGAVPTLLRALMSLDFERFEGDLHSFGLALVFLGALMSFLGPAASGVALGLLLVGALLSLATLHGDRKHEDEP